MCVTCICKITVLSPQHSSRPLYSFLYFPDQQTQKLGSINDCLLAKLPAPVLYSLTKQDLMPSKLLNLHHG